MFRVFFLTLLASGLLSAACSASATPILVRNVTIWNGDRLLQGKRDVLFRDGRIQSVRASISPQAGWTMIDGAGHTLLPGLIDLHLHFSVPGLPRHLRDYEITGRQLLRSGVTGGRVHLTSIANGKELKERSAESCALLPRLQIGGPGLAGGVPQTQGAAYFGVRDVDDAREKVRAIAEAGLDWLPVHDIHRFSRAEQDAIIDEARRARLKIFSAATNPEELRVALQHRVDTVDYIDRTDATTYPPDVLQALRRHRRQIAVVPNVGIFTRHASYRENGTSLETPFLYSFLEGPAAEAIRARARTDLASNDYVLSSARLLPGLGSKLRQLVDSGAAIGLGTDVGSPVHLHPGAIWWEMETWRTHGVPYERVLRAATSTAAQILSWPDAGRIAEGARADFVLYKGSIAEGSFEFSRVMAVGKAGVLLVKDGNWLEEETRPLR